MFVNPWLLYRLSQVLETTCDDPRVGGGGEASESNHSDVGSDKEAEQVEEGAGLGAGRGEGGVLTEACGSTPHDPMFGDMGARVSLHYHVHSL